MRVPPASRLILIGGSALSLLGSLRPTVDIDFIGDDIHPNELHRTLIEKARENAKKMNFQNVEFRHGDIDHMPVTSNLADVVVSNCVLNLVPDKPAAFREIATCFTVK